MHLVMYSGGLGSWGAAQRLKEAGEEILLVFADTLIEDSSVYRFVREGAQQLGAQLVHLADGRDPWQVFFDERYLGNTRADPCSKILKRQLIRRYLERYWDPARDTVVLGIDWTEEHRLERSRRFWSPWRVIAPLCDKPLVTKCKLRDAAEVEGLVVSALYADGFPHANCGGFCVKAGQAQFALLLRTHPDRYAYHERREKELREYLGKDVSILRDRRGGKTLPMALSAFRERVEAGGDFDRHEWGGCGCMLDPERGEQLLLF